MTKEKKLSYAEMLGGLESQHEMMADALVMAVKELKEAQRILHRRMIAVIPDEDGDDTEPLLTSAYNRLKSGMEEVELVITRMRQHLEEIAP